MRIVADFHIHSRFSSATSPLLGIPAIARMARRKGVSLIGTGDFTHPAYFQEIREHLEEAGNGFLRLKSGETGVHFVLSVEVSHVFQRGGKTKRVHQVVLLSSFAAAEKFNAALARWTDPAADGRPLLKVEARESLKAALDADPAAMVIPAHVWTPWFSLFGSDAGFDSLVDCYGTDAKHIHALETGLDSDPAMNRRVSGLDRLAMISASDAHSLERIGREASVFDCGFSYAEVMDAIRTQDAQRFLFTVELYPEIGKYFWDGHRACGISFHPQQAREHDFLCPACGRRVTVGVLHRLEQLADRSEDAAPSNRIPFLRVAPLEDVVAEALGQGADSRGVQEACDDLVHRLGPELGILIQRTPEDLRMNASEAVTEAILRMREGRMEIQPGYDGVYGAVRMPGLDRRRPAITKQGELF